MSLQCSDKFTTHLNQRTIDPNTENIKLFGIVWLAHAYRPAGYYETWDQLAWFKSLLDLFIIDYQNMAIMQAKSPLDFYAKSNGIISQKPPAKPEA